MNHHAPPMNAIQRKSVGILVAALVSFFSIRPVFADLNIRQIAPGIYYGAAPKSEADYRQLQQLGIRTVLELRKFMPRKSERERELVTRYGMNYRHVAMGFRPTRDNTPEEAVRILADPATHPIYFHCNLGRDRTGLVVALYRVRYLGWSRSAASAAMPRQRFNPFLRDLRRYFWRHAR